MRLTVYTFLLLFLSACTHSEQPETFTFVLPPHSNKGWQQDTLQIPFYAPFNFILDSSGSLFYYQQQRGILDCGTDYDYTTPAYIGLQPQDIIQLPKTAINAFLNANIFSGGSDYRVVSIAAVQDTIKAPVLRLLMSSFSDTANHTRYYIRKATQEEAVVLNHKLKGASYDVDNIAWDSSKIRFMPLLSNGQSLDNK